MSTPRSKINKCRLNRLLHASCTWEPHVHVCAAVCWIPTSHVNTTVTYLQLGLKHEEEIRHFPAKCLGFQHGCVPSAGAAASMDPRKANNCQPAHLIGSRVKDGAATPPRRSRQQTTPLCCKTGTQGTVPSGREAPAEPWPLQE